MPDIADSPILIQADNIRCERGERTLFTGLSWTLSGGRALHVAGPNGSGKSSLLRMVAGLITPEKGQISWCGEAIASSTEFRHQLAYMGHLDGLKNEMTAAENLQTWQVMNGLNSGHAVDRNLAKMGILDCADLTANKLSFGQRRRLAFARLLSSHRLLWVLDEPFTGIDRQGRRLIESICLQHLVDGGLLIVTNHQDLSNSPLADRLQVLQLDNVIAWQQ